MSRFAPVVIAILILAQAPLRAAGDPVEIPTSLVVDPCRFHSSASGLVTSEVTLMDIPLGKPLDEDAWATTDSGTYRGAAWASLPGYESSHLFMSRDNVLEVYDLDEPLAFTESPGISDAVNIVDVAALAGIPGFQIGRIAAGSYKPLVVEPGTAIGAAALYLIGTAGSTGRYVVIDQQWLIEGQAPTSTIVYGSGRTCADTSCVTLEAIDLAVGDLSTAAYSEEAYVTVLQDFSGFELALTYRLERALDGDGFTLGLVFGYPWGTPAVPRSSGLAFADASHDAYVVRKPGYVRNLADNSESCALAGEPTDVAVWEPGIASNVSRYLFVTTEDDTRGRVEIVPAAPCAAGGAPVVELKTQSKPTSLDLYVIDNDEVMVMVASEGTSPSVGGFEAIRVRLEVAGGDDTFVQVNDFEYDMTVGGWFSESCPSEVAVGVRRGLTLYDPPRGLDRNCLPGDPRCQR